MQDTMRDEPDGDPEIEPAPEPVPPPEPAAPPVAEPGSVSAPVWVRADWYVCIGLFLAAFVLVGLHVRAYETLSPIDELQHLDYVIRAGDLDIPRRNERVELEAMREAACRDVDAPGYVGPPCGLDDYDPENFQERGFNTAASQFPAYYVVTGLAARALTSIGAFDSYVTAGRMLGAVWLGAALSLTWYLMALLDIRRRYRAAVLAVLVPTPLIVFHGGATINADVALMLSGALAVLATMKYEAGRLRWWWLVPIYAGLFFVEATNVLAIAACGLYLVARRTFDASRPLAQRLAPVAIFPLLALMRLRVARIVQNALFPPAPVDRAGDGMGSAPMFTNHRTDGVSLDDVVAQLSSTFTPLHNPYFSPPLRSQLTIAGVQLANWLFIGLMFAAALVVVAKVGAAWWARVTMVMLLAAGPFYTFYFAYFSNSAFPAPARFALPLVPLMAVVAAAGVRTKPTFYVTVAVAALVGANTAFQLVTAV